MKTKLENLIAFDDFKAGWRAEQAKKTKRTDTGLDILKEGIEEIIPEGSEDDNFQVSSKYGSTDDMIDEIKATLDDLDEGQIDAIVNSLREALLEMEQQGFVEDDFTDTLDEETDGDWIEWITQVVELESLPEEALNNIMDIIDITSYDDVHSEENLENFEGDEEEMNFEGDGEEDYLKHKDDGAEGQGGW